MTQDELCALLRDVSVTMSHQALATFLHVHTGTLSAMLGSAEIPPDVAGRLLDRFGGFKPQPRPPVYP